jgi:hypothetical protein
LKRCVSCQREIPEPSPQCVFCGSSQELKRTLLGHAPADDRQRAASSSSSGPSYASGPSYSSGPVASRPTSSGPMTPSPNAPGPSYSSGPMASRPSSSGPMASRPSSSGPSGPSGSTTPSPFSSEPMEPRYSSEPQLSYAPGPFGGPAVPPAAAPVPVAPTWAVPSPAQPAWTPLAAYAPVEPWQDTLRVVCALFGLLLVALFLAPRSFDPLVFGWAVLQGELSAAILAGVAVAAFGLLAAVLALLPASTAARALVAAVAGTGAIVADAATWTELDWRLLAHAAGVLVAAAGLLIRSRYRTSMLARLATTAGVLAILAPTLVPVADQIPLLVTAKALGQASGIQMVAPLLVLLVALIAVISLIAVWLPPTISAAGTALAWVLLVAPVAITAAPLFEHPELFGRGPAAGYLPVTVMATRALGSYGLAALAGKLLEDS